MSVLSATAPDLLSEADAALERVEEAAIITGYNGSPHRANAAYLELAERLGPAAGDEIVRLEQLAGGSLGPATFEAFRDVRAGVSTSSRVVVSLQGRPAILILEAEPAPGGTGILWRLRFDQTFAGLGNQSALSDTALLGSDGAAPEAEHSPLVGAELDTRDLHNARVIACDERFRTLCDCTPTVALREVVNLPEPVPEDTAWPFPVQVKAKPELSIYGSVLPPKESGPRFVLWLGHEQSTAASDDEQSRKLQAIGRLASGVAHDFNNVLQAIMGFCDLLLARHPIADPSHEDLTRIKQNSVRGSALVQRLLAFSRGQEHNPKVQAVGDVLVEITDLLRRLLGTDVDLRLVHGREVPHARFDENQLEMAIVNLAVNARDAMPSGGLLEIATENVIIDEDEAARDNVLSPGRYARVCVTDTGTGMTEDVLERIFEPFFTTKQVGRGTGLGLSTVYGIVKQAGGHITCESALGRGTVFRIYLPAAQGEDVQESMEAEAVEEPAKPQNVPDLTGRGRILLVEDEEAVRLFTTRALESRGYEVEPVSDGLRALEMLEAGLDLDLVVSDVMMPGLDGPEFLQQARPMLGDAPVIFISGFGAEAVRSGLGDDERVHFLAKPFSLKDLAVTVRHALDSRGRG